MTPDVVAQLWAEACTRYAEGEPLTLGKELEAYAIEQQGDFTEDDPRAGEVQAYLDTLLPADWADKDKADSSMWISIRVLVSSAVTGYVLRRYGKSALGRIAETSSGRTPMSCWQYSGK